MAECELLKGCIFFNDKMDVESGLASLYKKKYCMGSPANCARYKIAGTLGKEKVPQDLYPNMMTRAEKIISKSENN